MGKRKDIITVVLTATSIKVFYIFANYSVAYDETQSNRVFDFRYFVCSLFPKAILYNFYFS